MKPRSHWSEASKEKDMDMSTLVRIFFYLFFEKQETLKKYK